MKLFPFLELNNTIIFLLFALFFILFGIILSRFVKHLFLKIKLTKRVRHSKKGENKTKEFLLKQGFHILNEQMTLYKKIFINGTPADYYVRADYLVKKGNEKAIVEVKTGNEAPDPKTIATRRQLFEYLHLYQVNKIYLFNADTLELKEVQFENISLRPQMNRLFLKGFVSGFIFLLTVLSLLTIIYKIII